MVMETAGPEDNVAKVMPPLIVDEETLIRGLDILRDSIKTALSQAYQSKIVTV